MRYRSTRGQTDPVGFTDAVAMGLAPDGGLLLPERLPDLSGHFAAWQDLGYAELCTAFLGHFATDVEPGRIAALCTQAFSGFSHPVVAPLHRLEDRRYVLELFHGPTLAFKDFALQLLGELYAEQIARTGEGLTILGATSGDTGAAAIHGLLGKPGVQIVMLYPKGGVSELQERQMTCTGADNVLPIAIEGTFDDAQAIIKSLFGDLDFRRAHRLSAVNSINLARILAQCVYYLYAWFQLPEAERDSVQFVVPTGNFGNVLAGWMARRMGLPVRGFTVATNQNDILYRLFTSGVYTVGPVQASLAPSMDIQVASNFERFLYYHEGEDAARVRSILGAFKATGTYTFEAFDADVFTASRASDADLKRLIAEVYQRYGYVVDPHTAAGFAAQAPEPGVTSVILGTAHPAKFPDTLAAAIGQRPTHPSLEALRSRSIARVEAPAQAAAIREHIAALPGNPPVA